MIEIVDYKALDKPSLKSQVTIRVPKWGGFLIKKIKVFQKDDSRWISFPAEEYEKEGKKKYYPLVEFDTPSMQEAFRGAFFKAYDDYVRNLEFDQMEKKSELSVPF